MQSAAAAAAALCVVILLLLQQQQWSQGGCQRAAVEPPFYMYWYASAHMCISPYCSHHQPSRVHWLRISVVKRARSRAPSLVHYGTRYRKGAVFVVLFEREFYKWRTLFMYVQASRSVLSMGQRRILQCVLV